MTTRTRKTARAPLTVEEAEVAVEEAKAAAADLDRRLEHDGDAGVSVEAFRDARTAVEVAERRLAGVRARTEREERAERQKALTKAVNRAERDLPKARERQREAANAAKVALDDAVAALTAAVEAFNADLLDCRRAVTDTGADGQDSVLVRRGERSERDGLRLDGETYLVLSPGREAAAILRDALVRVLSLDGWSMFATPRRELVNVIDRLSKDPEGRAEATERAKAHHAKQAERAQREAAERDARAAKPDPFPAPTGPGAEALARAQEGTR